MERRTIFGHRLLPLALVAPQFLLTLIFFLWPACQAVWSSLSGKIRSDCTVSSRVWTTLSTCSPIRSIETSIGRTAFFMVAVSALSMSSALFLAVFADREIRGRSIYRTLLIWPYAIAPAMAAVLWILLVAATYWDHGSLAEQAWRRMGLSPE